MLLLLLLFIVVIIVATIVITFLFCFLFFVFFSFVYTLLADGMLSCIYSEGVVPLNYRLLPLNYHILRGLFGLLILGGYILCINEAFLIITHTGLFLFAEKSDILSVLNIFSNCLVRLANKMVPASVLQNSD